jgi:hypothetical protein
MIHSAGFSPLGRRVRTGRPCGDEGGACGLEAGTSDPGASAAVPARLARLSRMRAVWAARVPRTAGTKTGAPFVASGAHGAGFPRSAPKAGRCGDRPEAGPVRVRPAENHERPKNPSAADRTNAVRGAPGDRQYSLPPDGGPALPRFPRSRTSLFDQSWTRGFPGGRRMTIEHTSAGIPPPPRGGWTGVARPGGVGSGSSPRPSGRMLPTWTILRAPTSQQRS